MLSRRMALPGYLLLATGVVAISLLIVRSASFALAPDLLGWAVSADVAMLLPAIYLLLAGRVGWPRLSAVPVFVLGLLVSRALLPAGHTGLAGRLGFVAAPLELFVLVYLVRETRRVAREYRAVAAGPGRFVEALEIALRRLRVPPRLAQILLTESSVIHYGLLGWTRRRSAPGDGTGFSYHLKCGYGAVVGVFVFLILLETSLVHLLLAPRLAVAAWTLNLLGLYGAVFLLADFNAARLRPVRIADDRLEIRVGLRWRGAIRLRDIEAVELPIAAASARKKDDFKAVLLGDPNLGIRLRRDATATGLYGLSRTFRRVLLAVDDPRGLARAIEDGRAAGA